MTDRGRLNQAKVQQYAVYLSTVSKHVVLSWATGVGKTLAALMIIDNYIKEKQANNQDYKRWYIVCAEKQHIQNWKDDIIKHKLDYLLDLGYLDIFCYASLHKYSNKEANLVLDEAHSVTNLRLDILQTIKYDLIVSLSATLPNERAVQLSQLSIYREYKLGIDQAIKAEMLPAPLYVKVEIDMDSSMTSQYQSLSDKIAFTENSLSNLNTFTEGFLLVKEDMNDKILRLKIKRKALVSEYKTATVAKITNILDNNCTRYICFCGSVAQSIKLVTNENRVAITSETGSKTNKVALKTFDEGSYSGLFVNKMLRQGTNLNRIEAGIIVQLDYQELNFIQMVGRVLRSDNPVIFVIICKNTFDEVYWDRCTYNIDPNYIVDYNTYNEQHSNVKKEDRSNQKEEQTFI